MPTYQLTTLLRLRARRVTSWLHAQVHFSWIDTLDADYHEWKPEGPIYERLIR